MTQLPHIIFAGAGPGDAGLVTVKLVEALKSAECILVDRLVNPEILKLYAHVNAEIIFVGKQAYEKESTPQQDINELLVEKAMAGLKTIRLKGGDVAIYSNVLDEINAIQSAGIRYEIIPGITAASGAAASLGIALTGRNISPGIQIHSMSIGNVIEEKDYTQWATTNDTLVFYMSIRPLKDLLRKLKEYGAEDELPLVIIEEATSPAQKNSRFTLISFLDLDEYNSFRSPALVIIGTMVNEINMDHFIQQANIISIFNPINTTTKNNTIHVS